MALFPPERARIRPVAFGLAILLCLGASALAASFELALIRISVHDLVAVWPPASALTILMVAGKLRAFRWNPITLVERARYEWAPG